MVKVAWQARFGIFGTVGIRRPLNFGGWFTYEEYEEKQRRMADPDGQTEDVMQSTVE